MHPILFVLGPITIYSFGFMIAVAALTCSYLFGRDLQKNGLNKDIAYDFIFWTALSGIIGARIFYILLNLDYFTQDPSEIYQLQNGGLAWQGGLIFAVAAGTLYLKKRRLPILRFLDHASPYAALGQAIGRIGCFLNGCCYGKPVWWGPYFPIHEAHLHPTQVYESAGLVVVFFILRKLNAKKFGEGQVAAIYLMLAAILRFIVQFFRDDHDPIWFGLSIFQWVCVAVLLAAVVFFWTVKRRERAA